MPSRQNGEEDLESECAMALYDAWPHGTYYATGVPCSTPWEQFRM